MNKNEKDSIRKYDKIADQYDSSFDGKFTAKLKERLSDFCIIQNGNKVLDVGCGNGKLIGMLSQKAAIEAHGVDISPNMIEACKKKYPKISFSVGSAEKLNFENESFDMLIICCVLHHLNNPDHFMEEARRVLKQDGILIVAEPWFPWPIRQIVNWMVSPLLKAGDNQIFSHKRLQTIIKNNGFEITAISKKGFKQMMKTRKIQ